MNVMNERGCSPKPCGPLRQCGSKVHPLEEQPSTTSRLEGELSTTRESLTHERTTLQCGNIAVLDQEVGPRSKNKRIRGDKREQRNRVVKRTVDVDPFFVEAFFPFHIRSEGKGEMIPLRSL